MRHGRETDRRRRTAGGFTLVEVLLVILILGMLIGALVVAVMPERDKARINTTQLQIGQIESALERYEMAIGRYPSEEDGGLDALITRPTFEDEALAQNWSGPYLKQEPRDAWQRPIRYELSQSETDAGGKPFRIWSLGPDGQDGTADDIRNWKEGA